MAHRLVQTSAPLPVRRLHNSANRAKEKTQATSTVLLSATHQKEVNTSAESTPQTSVQLVIKGTIKPAPVSPLVSGGVAVSLLRDTASGGTSVTDPTLTTALPLRCFPTKTHFGIQAQQHLHLAASHGKRGRWHLHPHAHPR